MQADIMQGSEFNSYLDTSTISPELTVGEEARGQPSFGGGQVDRWIGGCVQRNECSNLEVPLHV